MLCIAIMVLDVTVAVGNYLRGHFVSGGVFVGFALLFLVILIKSVIEWVKDG